MADNSFTRAIQLANIGKEVNTRVENIDTQDLEKANGLFTGMADSTRTLSQEMGNVRNQVNALVDDVAKIYSTMNNNRLDGILQSQIENIQSRLSGMANDMKQTTNGIVDDVIRAMDTINDGGQLTQKEFQTIVDTVKDLGLKFAETKQEAENLKNTASQLGITENIAPVFKVITDTVEQVHNLEEALNNVSKSGFIPGLKEASDQIDSFRGKVQQSAESIGRDFDAARESFTKFANGESDKSNGTELIIKQMSKSLEDMSKILDKSELGFSGLYTQISSLKEVDGSHVTESLQSGVTMMTLLEERIKAAQDAIKSGANPEALASQYGAMVGVLDQLGEKYSTITDFMQKFGNKINDKEMVTNFVSNFNQMSQVIKNFQDTAKVAFGDVANLEQSQASWEANMGTPLSVSNSPTGLAGISAGIGNILGGTKGIPGLSRILGTVMGTMGIKSLMSPSGLIGGVFSADRDYGQTAATSSLYDLMHNVDDAGMIHQMMNEGYDYATATHGMIQSLDFEKQRQWFANNVIGHYGSGPAPQDMGQLATQSTLYQKAYGVDSSTMNTALNDFYKELRLNLGDTEFAMAKVADSARQLNVPFSTQLRLVDQLAMNYKNMGIGIDQAINAANNLMGGQYGMNATDAQQAAQGVGNALGGMSQGQAAFMGMAFGGAGDPFQAMMAYNNRWLPNGQQNQNWAPMAAKMLDQYSGLIGSMGGGDPSATQWLKYQTYMQMGMDQKTADMLAQVNDPNQIQDILLKSQNGTISGNNGSTAAGNQANSDMKSAISQASDNLSGVDKTMNQLKTEQMNLAVVNHDFINHLTDYSNQIHQVGSSMGNLSKSIDSLTHVNEALILALGTLAGLSIVKKGADAATTIGDIANKRRTTIKTGEVAAEESRLAKYTKGMGRYGGLIIGGGLLLNGLSDFLDGGSSGSSDSYSSNYMGANDYLPFDASDPSVSSLPYDFSQQPNVQYSDNSPLVNGLNDSKLAALGLDFTLGSRMNYGTKAANGILRGITQPGNPMSLLAKSEKFAGTLSKFAKFGGDFFAPLALFSGGLDVATGAYDAYKNPADRQYALRDIAGQATSDLGFTGLGAIAGLGWGDEVTVPIGMGLDALDTGVHWITGGPKWSTQLGDTISGVSGKDIDRFKSLGMNQNAAMSAAHYFENNSDYLRGMSTNQQNDWVVSYMNAKNANPKMDNSGLAGLADVMTSTNDIQSRIHQANMEQVQKLDTSNTILSQNGQLSSQTKDLMDKYSKDFSQRDEDTKQNYLTNVKESLGPDTWNKLLGILAASGKTANSIDDLCGYFKSLQSQGAFTTTNDVQQSAQELSKNPGVSAKGAVSAAELINTKYQSQLNKLNKQEQSTWKSTFAEYLSEHPGEEEGAVKAANAGLTTADWAPGTYLDKTLSSSQFLHQNYGSESDVKNDFVQRYGNRIEDNWHGHNVVNTQKLNKAYNDVLTNFAKKVGFGEETDLTQILGKHGISNTAFAEYLVRTYGSGIIDNHWDAMTPQTNTAVASLLPRSKYAPNINYVPDTAQTGYASGSSSSFNQLLKGSSMAGLGGIITQASQQYGVNPALLYAIAGAEQSLKDPGNHNLYGLTSGMGYGTGGFTGGFANFSNISDSVLAAAKNLSQYNQNGWTTLQEIQQHWAPNGASNDPRNLNSQWLKNVMSYLQRAGINVSANWSPFTGTDGGADASSAYNWTSSGTDYMSQYGVNSNDGNNVSISILGSQGSQLATDLQSFATQNPRNNLVKPLSTSIGSKSPYALNGIGDPLYSTKGLYQGSMAYSDQGMNTQAFARDVKEGAAQYNIYIQQDPAKASDYYDKFASYLQSKIDEAQKEFAQKYYESKGN